MKGFDSFGHQEPKVKEPIDHDISNADKSSENDI